MCGIFSYLSKTNIYSKSLDFRQIILENFLKIQHRGPDNSSIVNINDKLIFGFHRLAIVDKSNLGNQPFIIEELDDDERNYNIYLICNGEIYNHKQLKQEYNLQTQSNSDCEVILQLYKHFTRQYQFNHIKESISIEEKIQNVIFKIASLLDGVFAFQIFDERYNMLSIGRDPIGVRSLYYGYNDTSICFASEMKAIDKIAMHVQFFPPGSVISFDIDDVHHYFKKNFNKRVQQYYYCNYEYKSMPVDQKKYYDYCKLNIESLLTKAVDKRIMSDRPIGCLLSGGLDSSLIAALLAKKMKLQNKNLHTFSIGFKGATDLHYAKMVADHIGSIHHEVIVTEKEMLCALDKVIYKIESWDTTTIRASTPMILLCEYIKQNTNITVIYSGEGSDEASGSYMYFHNAPDEKAFHKETCRLVNDLQYYDVLRSDKSISSAGLEVRVPFLDKDFLEFYMSIHPSLKMGNTDKKHKIEKYLLRDTFNDGKLLPSKVLWRVKEAFSDGCSPKEKSWYTIIQEFVKNSMNNNEKNNINEQNYTHQPPQFQEALYYRTIFEKYFPNRDTIIPYYWVPKWSGDVVEPSARVLEVYNA